MRSGLHQGAAALETSPLQLSRSVLGVWKGLAGAEGSGTVSRVRWWKQKKAKRGESPTEP